jgi:hypothetical protein
MKALYTGFVTLALAALVGCTGSNTGTTEKHPGGPGAGTNPTERGPLVGEGEGQFELKPPILATHIKQGEQKVVKISIDRGKNFDEDVTLKFEGSPDMPKGLTFDPASPVIKHSDKEADVTVKAADDAAVGDFKIKVIGKPTKGKEAAHTFELKIDKK